MYLILTAWAQDLSLKLNNQNFYNCNSGRKYVRNEVTGAIPAFVSFL
jgi:hypothetical protein